MVKGEKGMGNKNLLCPGTVLSAFTCVLYLEEDGNGGCGYAGCSSRN